MDSRFQRDTSHSARCLFLYLFIYSMYGFNLSPGTGDGVRPCALAVAHYTKSLSDSAPRSPSAALALGRAC
jgi:hypothetical protein